MKESVKYLIEPAHAAESRCKGNIGHRHPGLVNEVFSKEHAPGLRDCNGRSAEMLQKQPAQLPLSQAKPLCKLFYGCSIAIECAVMDESQRA